MRIVEGSEEKIENLLESINQGTKRIKVDMYAPDLDSLKRMEVELSNLDIYRKNVEMLIGIRPEDDAPSQPTTEEGGE